MTNGRLCELVNGVLVKKTMDFREGFLAMWIGTLINEHLMGHNIGLVAGAGSGI
jgi:hypothetical protein